MLNPVPQEYPLVRISSPSESAVYQCWAGEVRSAPIFVNVQSPQTGIDIQALDYINKLSPHTGIGERMRIAYPYLKERFPTSSYTLISSIFVSPELSDALFKDVMQTHTEKYLHDYSKMMIVLDNIWKDQIVKTELLSTLPQGVQGYLNQVQFERKKVKKR